MSTVVESDGIRRLSVNIDPPDASDIAPEVPNRTRKERRSFGDFKRIILALQKLFVAGVGEVVVSVHDG